MGRGVVKVWDEVGWDGMGWDGEGGGRWDLEGDGIDLVMREFNNEMGKKEV